MCFLPGVMVKRSQKTHYLHINIVKCGPKETCEKHDHSNFAGLGLGSVQSTLHIILHRHLPSSPLDICPIDMYVQELTPVCLPAGCKSQCLASSWAIYSRFQLLFSDTRYLQHQPGLEVEMLERN